MAFQPAGSLKNRTFIGLIIAQFLAGFNDQAIHASAMFFALKQHILTEAQAISLMPILFFSPWAIFCTISGFLADRYSKTTSLIVWKYSEIVISLIALAGFWIGTQYHQPFGPWLVLFTVFLMGTHAAFFAPAKYGAMPEILQAHVLSRGNGILESTTFLAAILGTVTGGYLSFVFSGHEHWIGVILLGLSVVGAGASMMIARLPPANPSRIFPANPFKPLWDNLKVLMKSKPLALSVLGIAFFIFMVAYMRQTMYMHGETRNPRWNEAKTSLIVATVALGVGLGAPLSGYLSGGKVELGMVPLGCLGMIVATLLSGFNIDHEMVLVVSLIVIGFFSGFYMVPLYTLLQHRAPKASKGDLVATSNFINVMGAMAASVLFFLLVQLGRFSGLTPVVPQTDNVAVGTLEEMKYDDHGHLQVFRVKQADDTVRSFFAKGEEAIWEFVERASEAEEGAAIELEEDGLLSLFGGMPALGDSVIVSSYKMPDPRNNKDVHHFNIRAANQPLRPVYNNQGLPRYLFIGAALMTLGILVLLWRKLPDFFTRTLYWVKSVGKFQLKAVGMHNLPTNGPVLLATNCDRLENSLQLISVTDRFTTVVVPHPAASDGNGLLRQAAQRTNLVLVNGPGADAWKEAYARARAALANGDMLAVGVDGEAASSDVDEFLRQLRATTGAPLVPVFCGPLDPHAAKPRIRVVFGEASAPQATLADLRSQIQHLGEWIRRNDDTAAILDHH